MPIIKKLKYDLDGDGIETVIKISIDSKGNFSADVPLHVKSCTRKCVVGLTSMGAAINLVDDIVREYQQAKRTEKWVILIEFKKHKQPFLNEGIGMKLNYLIANKHQFGKQIDYKVVDKDMNGNYREIGNHVSESSFANEGVVAGKSLEIDFTEEKLQTIKDLQSKLEFLCEKLSEICNSEEQFMSLVGNNIKLLG